MRFLHVYLTVLTVSIFMSSKVSSVSTKSLFKSLSSLASLSWGSRSPTSPPSSKSLSRLFESSSKTSSRAGRRNDKYFSAWSKEPTAQTTTTTQKPIRRKWIATNSPITFIKLPASPYSYDSGTYISRHSSKNDLALNFFTALNKGERVRGGAGNRFPVNRPDVNYISNAKPYNVYKWMSKIIKATTPTATTTTTTTTTTTPPSSEKGSKTKNSPIIWLGKFLMNGIPSKIFDFKSPFSSLYWSNSLEETPATSSPILLLFKNLEEAKNST